MPDEIYRQLTTYMARIAERLGVPRDQCEDMAQEAWVRVFKHPERFHGEHELEELGLWLSRIAHNVAVDALRRSAILPAHSLEGSAADPLDEKEAKRADTAEWSECLTVWLTRLRQEGSENCWLVCERYLEGRTVRELAEERGRMAHEICCRIWRAIVQLRSLMQGTFPQGKDAS